MFGFENSRFQRLIDFVAESVKLKETIWLTLYQQNYSDSTFQSQVNAQCFHKQLA